MIWFSVETVSYTHLDVYKRQLPALHSTIGKLKAEIVGERLLDINPELQLTKINEFLNPENMEDILDSQKFDYVLDLSLIHI